jgi:sugar O-acyltransferase (sialic acid O-acetyltransferase NeuD family)
LGDELQLIILGAGSVARELLVLIDNINRSSTQHKIRVCYFAVDELQNRVEYIEGVKVIQSDAIFSMDTSSMKLICAAGDPSRAGWISQYEGAGFKFTSIIDPSAVISKCCIIGDGCIIYPGAFISCETVIGRHVLVQANCSLMHDVKIGNYCTICPGVQIGGFSVIGDRAFIGIGTSIIDRLVIGDDVLIGAGSTVIRNVSSGVVCFGNPARIVKNKPD